MRREPVSASGSSRTRLADASANELGQPRIALDAASARNVMPLVLLMMRSG